ncbi:MAG TPA: hypothetical protein VK978_01950 [Candidatus Saccharimonadales bacterium]|nr:hypothetical protein [Candidatus Saccharimonadales bacterium]
MYENENLTHKIISLLTAIKQDFTDCYLLAGARAEGTVLESFDEPLRMAFKTIP